MGQQMTREQLLYLRTLQQLLKAAYCTVSEDQLVKLLQTVHEICPWFPDQDLELWEQAGRTLKRKHDRGKRFPPIY